MKKRQLHKQKISDLENLRSQNEIREFYKNLNRQRKGTLTTSNASIVNSKTGNLLSNKADVLNRWVEYFDELLNGDSDSSTPTLPTIYRPNPESLSRCLYGMGIILRSKYISRSTKFAIYKTLIVPVLIYGSEAWTLAEKYQRQLEVFERKVLRDISGTVCIEGE